MTDFLTAIDRRDTRSVKWGRVAQAFSIQETEGILPMWIADMDFAAPEAVLRALQNRLDHKVFGYSYMCDRCRGALVDWLDRRHGWSVEPESIHFQHGIVPALASIVEAFTKEGDRVGITTPVYAPFFQIPALQGRLIADAPLLEIGGSYAMNFEAIERLMEEGMALFILCNPHNPGGRVWPARDLQRLASLCRSYDVLLVSDEIHADLTLPPHVHTPLAKAAPDYAHGIITCVAPTKTFNLAGIQAAAVIIEDPEKRLRFANNAAKHGQMDLNAFAASAFTAAYEEGEPWLADLLAAIDRNAEIAIGRIEQALPAVRIAKPEATYLLWMDVRALGYTEDEAQERLLSIGRLALEPGSKYGASGRGFFRMNIACPEAVVRDGVERFIRAFQESDN